MSPSGSKIDLKTTYQFWVQFPKSPGVLGTFYPKCLVVKGLKWRSQTRCHSLYLEPAGVCINGIGYHLGNECPFSASKVYERCMSGIKAWNMGLSWNYESVSYFNNDLIFGGNCLWWWLLLGLRGHGSCTQFSRKDECKLLGFLNYYRQYFQDFSLLAKPLYDLILVLISWLEIIG